MARLLDKAIFCPGNELEWLFKKSHIAEYGTIPTTVGTIFAGHPFCASDYFTCGASAEGGLSVHFLFGEQKKVNNKDLMTLNDSVVLSFVLIQRKVPKEKSRLSKKMAGNFRSEETNKLGAFGAVGQYLFLNPTLEISSSPFFSKAICEILRP